MTPKDYAWLFLAGIRKDTKRLLSSKINTFFLLFAPILLIFLIGFAFQGEDLYGVQIGLYADSEVVENSVQSYAEENGYTLNQYGAEQQCLDATEQGDDDVCILITTGDTIKADLYVDYTNIQLAANIVTNLDTVFEEIETQLLTAFGETLRSGAENLETELASFTTTLNDTQSIITDITAAVNGSTVEIPNTTLREIPEVNDVLVAIQTDISSAQTALQDTKAQIDSQREELEAAEEQLSAQRTVQNCAEYPYVLESDQETFEEALNNADDPACFYLDNFHTAVELRINTLNDVETQVNEQTTTLSIFDDRIDEVGNNSVKNLFGDELGGIAEEQRRQQQTVTATATDIENTLSAAANSIASLQEAELITALRNAEDALKPVEVEVNRYESLTGITYLDILFPGVLTTLVAFIGIIVGNTLSTREYLSPAQFRNQLTPSSHYILPVSNTATATLITFLQALLVTVVGYVFFGLHVAPGFQSVFLLFVAAVVFSVGGQLIGTLIRNQEIATLLSIITAITFMLFSPLVLPVERLHPFFGAIFSLSPFNIVESGLKAVMVLQQNMGWATFLGVTAYLVVGTAALLATIYVHNQQKE